MYQEWNLVNDGLSLKIKNLGFGGEELYINNELVDKTKTIFGSARLIAQYNNKLIKVNLGSYKGGMKIEITIDEDKVFEETIGMFNFELLKSALPTMLISGIAVLMLLTLVGIMF